MPPNAYTYPAKNRPTRDLLLHSWDLVTVRATECRRIHNPLHQHGVCDLGLVDIKAFETENVECLLAHPLSETKGVA